MLLLDIGKYVGQKYSPKYKYSFASFIIDRGLSLDDKTKDYVDRNTGGTWGHTTRVIISRWKFAYLSDRTKKIISRKLKYIFTKTLQHNYKDISGYKIWKWEWRKTNFGRLAKIFQICSMDTDILS